MITVYIDNDPASLGTEATREDVDGYARNLAAYLSARFELAVDVKPVLGGGPLGRCPDNDEIADHVDELHASNKWLDLVPTYDAWWAAVLGANRDAAEVLREFGRDRSEREIDEWLGGASKDAWLEGPAKHVRLPMPESWQAFHRRALRELLAVAEAIDRDPPDSERTQHADHLRDEMKDPRNP